MKPVKKSIALGILCVLWNCSAANGQSTVTLLNDSANGVSAFIGVSQDIYWAQRFTMPAKGINYQITGLTLCNIITNFNYGTIIANVSLWSASNGVPGSEIGLIGTPEIYRNGDFTFSPSASLQLSSGQSYFIEFTAPNGFWELTGTTTNGATGLGTFGQIFEYINGGWTSYDDMPASMILTAAPVPEPSFFGFGILGAVGVLTLQRRNVR